MLKCDESTAIEIDFEPVSPNVAVDPNLLKNQLDGKLISHLEGFEYDLARSLWNGALNIRPWAIAQAQNITDLQKCLHFAAEHNVKNLYF